MFTGCENRVDPSSLVVCACGPKTVPVKRTFLNIAIVGWGGGGMLTFLVLRTWNIATLLTSLGSFTTLYVATLLMGWGGVGWGGMLTFLVLRTWNIATLLRSLGSFTTLHVATLLMGWGGVGWGGMLTFLVLRTWYIAMLLRSLGSFTTLHVATLLMGWGGVGGHVNVPCTSYMKYCYAAEISGIVYYVTCCYAAESGIWWKSQFPATWVPKVTFWWCMLELGNGDAFTRMLTASW